ncbi:type I methionyl aminopeptidase [Myxococcota bacterium]|nr:type I methionyl aminopeptidase [Myxococcota bacterium]
MMRQTCLLAAATLKMIGRHVQPGVSTQALNDLCDEFIRDHGAIPSPLNYKGFPRSICTSVNEVVCHGIPSARQVLREGDIVNVDVTTLLGGFHGDCSATFCVGQVSKEARHVVEVSRQCLALGIEQVRPGGHIGDIGAAIERHAHAEGCSVVRDFCGHGIGRQFHCAPEVPHFGRRGEGEEMFPNLTFTIEPMINLGRPETRILGDGWTAVTVDRKLSAQFEHTLLVTRSGVDVLTDPEKLRGTRHEALL